MANSVLENEAILTNGSKMPDRIRGLVWKLAIATLLLMAVGSATRVMNAGLACPDWPLCYGTLIPTAQMNLQVFLEWFHRLDAALIGCGAIALVILSWWQKQYLPRWQPILATVALGLIVFQGVLGGLTVTELLRFDIVTAHLGTALLYFTTLLIMGTSMMPYQATGEAGKLFWLGLAGAIFVYLQSLLGGLVASQWAVHQCLMIAQLCTVMNSHIVGVLPATVTIISLWVIARRTAALSVNLRQLADTAGLLLISQILLGLSTFRLHLQVEILTVSHQAVGAALLGTLVTFTVLAWRDQQTTVTLTGNQQSII
jgi:cytochrome c oxidase assembly protein subunit 15